MARESTKYWRRGWMTYDFPPDSWFRVNVNLPACHAGTGRNEVIRPLEEWLVERGGPGENCWVTRAFAEKPEADGEPEDAPEGYTFAFTDEQLRICLIFRVNFPLRLIEQNLRFAA